MVGSTATSEVVAGVVSHIGDQVGRLVITGFGDMHLVTRPFRLALFAVASIRVIGGADQQRRWRQISRMRQRTGWSVGAGVELLEPDLPQGLNGGELPQPGGCGRIVDGPQQSAAVHTNLLARA